MTPPSIVSALSAIEDWIDAEATPGAAVVVWRDGEIVAEQYAGDAQPGIAVDARTIFALASVTKPVVATTVMVLAEQGLLSIDEPVVRFVPEFAASDVGEADSRRRDVTIRQLLAHTSGVPYDLPRGMFRTTEAPDIDAITDAMCRLPLVSDPGTSHLYSNAGYAILGRLIEAATATDVWELTADLVLDPLELHDTVAQPGAALNDRIALVADTASAGKPTESFNSPYWRDLGMTWAGLYGTPRDLARFASSFLTGGPRILAEATIDLMTDDQVRGLPGEIEPARVQWPIGYWGLGWEVKGAKQRHWTGELTSPATFCHFGASGTLLWADPTRGIAAAIFANRTTYRAWPFVPARWARLSNAIVAALDRA